MPRMTTTHPQATAEARHAAQVKLVLLVPGVAAASVVAASVAVVVRRVAAAAVAMMAATGLRELMALSAVMEVLVS